ncbi:MAG: succinate dehydrogenase, partial [Terriglobus sp.]
RGRSNVNVYPWAGNWMYLAQRASGIIALLYIIQHLYFQRFTGVSLPEHPGLAYWKVQYELSNPLMVAVYVIGMIATCFHFAYGIWLFCAKWGITPGDEARRKLGYATTVFGVILCALGLWSIFAIVTAPPVPAVEVMPAQSEGVVAPTVPTYQVPLVQDGSQQDQQAAPPQYSTQPQQ